MDENARVTVKKVSGISSNNDGRFGESEENGILANI